MCGIFAYIQRQKVIDLQTVQQQFQKIKHRGPDYTSSKLLQKNGYEIFLGFHRLAIIDPAVRSNFLLEDQGVYLICNGEIYNYQYLVDKYSLQMTTGSDCEVILQLYHSQPNLWPNILHELDGVFAFVLYDHNQGRIFASRDRYGVRPMFIASTDSVLTFASEAKAISERTVKPFSPGLVKEVLLDNLSLNYLPHSQYIWHRQGSYFHLDYSSAQVIVRELFTAAVKKRLMSDRPIGFLVSGGLDSSLVASVASRLLNQQITTFSIGLPGSPDLIAARKVADYLKSDHHEIHLTLDQIVATVPDVVYQNESYDITTTRASIPMYLLAKWIRTNTDIKVIFSGEGADELLGGYLYFWKAPGYKEFQKESQRLITDLYKYDVLRGDRTTAAWGLELRVPFLDADFVNFVLNLDPAHKMPATHDIEKALMREAFRGYLPDEILFRQKEAFSDGVGYNSVGALKQAADIWAAGVTHPQVWLDESPEPTTNEGFMYLHYFLQHYVSQPDLRINYYWMPKWQHDVTDPSATVLSEHLSGLKN
jgi:asparagine synthase (glutamine-hydrolysing)